MKKNINVLTYCAMLLGGLSLVLALASRFRIKPFENALEWLENVLLTIRYPRRTKALRQIEARKKQVEQFREEVAELRNQLMIEIRSRDELKQKVTKLEREHKRTSRKEVAAGKAPNSERELEVTRMSEELRQLDEKVSQLRDLFIQKENSLIVVSSESQVFIAKTQANLAVLAANKMLNSRNFIFPKESLIALVERNIARREKVEMAQLEKFVRLFANCEIEILNEDELRALSDYLDQAASDLMQVTVDLRCFETAITAKLNHAMNQHQTWLVRSNMAKEQNEPSLAQQCDERVKHYREAIKYLERQIEEPKISSVVLAKLCADIESISTQINSRLQEAGNKP